MKVYLQLLVLSILLASCKNVADEIPVTSFEDEMEMKKWDSTYSKFQRFEIDLYKISNTKPRSVLSKIDSLLLVYKSDENIKTDLHYFKAEIFYKLNDYNKSIDELKFVTDRETSIPLACNYIKLKKFEKAKSLLDSITKNDIGFDDFVYGNYYETVKQKSKALEKYRKIQGDQSSKRFFYYDLAIKRLIELKKSEPKFLDAIYFPTNNPEFKENINENGI